MRLSIGIPAYNQGDFLRETLASTLRQDEPFHEIVVSNNHSTDSTAAVIAAVQQEFPGRVRTVTPPSHLTMVGNWNFTAAQLTGDWFSLLSSDDLAKPGFVRSVAKAAALSEQAAMVRGAWENLFPDGKVELRQLLSVAPVTKLPKTLYEQRFGPKCSFAAFALRRDVWEKAGGFPENVTLVGDWGMWLMAGAMGDVVYAPETIASYRLGHQSAVTRRRHHTLMREIFTIYDEVLPRATELAGLGRPPWIAQASRTRLREVMRATSGEFAADERGLLIEAFRPWAQATGERAMLQRFERGEVLRHVNLAAYLRSLARTVVMKLRGAR